MLAKQLGRTTKALAQKHFQLKNEGEVTPHTNNNKRAIPLLKRTKYESKELLQIRQRIIEMTINKTTPTTMKDLSLQLQQEGVAHTPHQIKVAVKKCRFLKRISNGPNGTHRYIRA